MEEWFAEPDVFVTFEHRVVQVQGRIQTVGTLSRSEHKVWYVGSRADKAGRGAADRGQSHRAEERTHSGWADKQEPVA